jgi:hypothetical protein
MKEEFKERIIGTCSNETHIDYCGEDVDLITFEYKGCWGCLYFTEADDFPFYSVLQASYILKVSPSTIRRWIGKGKLNAELFEQIRKTTSLPAPKKYYIQKESVDEINKKHPLPKKRKVTEAC